MTRAAGNRRASAQDRSSEPRRRGGPRPTARRRLAKGKLIFLDGQLDQILEDAHRYLAKASGYYAVECSTPWTAVELAARLRDRNDERALPPLRFWADGNLMLAWMEQ